MALFISPYILLFNQEILMELLESSGGPYNVHENLHTSKKSNIDTRASQGRVRPGEGSMGWVWGKGLDRDRQGHDEIMAEPGKTRKRTGSTYQRQGSCKASSTVDVGTYKN